MANYLSQRLKRCATQNQVLAMAINQQPPETSNVRLGRYRKAPAVQKGLGDVGSCSQSASHIAVQSAVADRKLAFIAGAEHDGSEFIRKRHQHHATSAGLNVFFRLVFLPAGKHFLQNLAIGFENPCDTEQFKADS